jgi:glycosyltransferase involved in cell wall biosynthesis
MPQISVIVPVYKVEPYLRRCVDSILAQTFEDFELILVDDGSPDQCPAICDEYAAKDLRVKVIHQSNGGLSAARNAGLDWIFTHSDSQWIFFVDSDDWIHPVTLECMLKTNLKFNTSICICGHKITTGTNPNFNLADLHPCSLETEFFFVEYSSYVACAPGKLYRKDCFQNLRYPVGKIHEDVYTTYKILFQYPSVTFISAPLYAYFFNQEGITKSQWSPKRLDEIDAFKQQLVYFQTNGFKKAYKSSCMAYLFCLANQIELMGNEYPAIKKRLQKQLRQAFWKYRKDAGVTLAKDPWICSSAFPTFITPFLQIKKLLQILKVFFQGR